MAAMAVSSTGDWVGFVAVAALVTRLGGSAATYAVAGVMASRMLPSILFGPFAGVLVDRMNRKHLMVAADLSRAVMYSSMPLIGALWGIYVLSFFIECLALLWVPAKDSSVPNIVPRRQLVNANTVGMATAYGTLPLGGLLFTGLTALSLKLGDTVPYFHHAPESFPLWLDALSFLFSAYMVNRLPLRAMQPSRVKFQLSRAGEDVKDGIRFLREHSLARAMTVGIIVAFCGVGSVIALGPIYASRVLHAGAPGWGFLVTAIGVGMGLGMASVPQVSRYVDRELMFPFEMLGAAVFLILVAAMPSISLAATLTVLMGLFAGATWVTGYALLQENVADEYRGRTFATLTVMSRLGLFLSLTGFPLLAGVLDNLPISGVRLALWIGGAVAILGAVATRRGLRRHRLSKPQPLSLLPRIKKTQSRGYFVAFEGVENSGKGTQIRMAREFLEAEGFEVLVTREPGGTEVGEQLRQLLLDPATGLVEPRTEALLFAASRAQHVATVIRPALERGQVVLCDRYVDSSLAYQGVARGLGEQDVLTLNVWATQGLFPDLVLLFHLEPEIGRARSADDRDRIESESEDFHAKVADAFLRIAEEHPERFVVIEAAETAEGVHEQVREALLRLLRPPEEGGPMTEEQDSEGQTAELPKEEP
jgi:dTMP kinase